jgi:hypothetical protein
MLRKRGLFYGVLPLVALVGVLFVAAPWSLKAQNNSGMIQGTVTDPSKAAVPGAKVHLENPVSGHINDVETDANGSFRIANIPMNPYHLTVTAPGFATFAQDVDVRTTVPITLDISLMIGTATTSITVTENAADLVEVTPTEHTDVDRGLFEKLPLESQSSSISSLITLASPGIVADSNGLFHGLGDHAENSFSLDGQPITDQQSKVFSNQIPSDAVQSMEVIEGAPPAEYGDKTSVVINVTTRSGLGVMPAHGSVIGSYGSFGTSNEAFDLSFGNQKWGNFIAANGLNTSRFLDPPEYTAFHDKGNEENIFDRVDLKPSNADAFQLDAQYTRSRFQTPDTYDQLNVGAMDPITGSPLGITDQSSYIRTFDISPSWTHIFNPNTVFTLGAFARQDIYTYYPSANPFADFSPEQSETIGQNRSLTNVGGRAAVSYVKGIHNIKAGITYEHTLLHENDRLAIVDPGYLSTLTDAAGNPCLDVTGTPIDSPCTDSFPFDLTCGGTFSCTGSYFNFAAHTDVKELALYFEDAITKGSWTFNLGLRGDFYNGLTTARQAEPRLGIAYNFKPTNTVFRVSYARTLETPFNENLILSSTGCNSPVLAPLLICTPGANSLLSPGWRNEFHAGLEQAFGKYFVLSGEYIWKYTHNAYDFSVLGTTPITFPIEWDRSKIPGFAVRASVPNFHGLTAFVVMAHVAARFFNPQIGGAGATPPGPIGSVFRIDHDENFEQTTHIQYQPFKRAPWVGFNWRYDSGLVAGALPCASCGGNGPLGDSTTTVDTSGLTPDQQFEAGLFCGSVFATPTTPISSALGPNLCPASQYGSKFLKVPAPGTEDDDHNPPRVLPRHLFDLAIGHDNLFNADRYKVSLRFTIVNLTNKEAVYNFLSTFSGTHYVTPRTETVELGFHF